MTRQATVAELDRELAQQALRAQASLAQAQAETVEALVERDAARAQVQEHEQSIGRLVAQLREMRGELEEARRQIYWLERLHLSRFVARPTGRTARIVEAGVHRLRARRAR